MIATCGKKNTRETKATILLLTLRKSWVLYKPAELKCMSIGTPWESIISTCLKVVDEQVIPALSTEDPGPHKASYITTVWNRNHRTLCSWRATAVVKTNGALVVATFSWNRLTNISAGTWLAPV